MKFGISSYVWVSPFSNETFTQLEKAKSFGFDIYEIGVEDPSTFDPIALKKKADAVGIQILICGAFGERRDIGSEDPAIRKEGVSYIKTLIDYAQIVGSPIVSGPMYAAGGKTRITTKNEKQKQMNRVIRNLKELCAYANSKQIALALEPLNRFETDLINTTNQGLALIDAVGFDNLGLLLDTFHMNIEEKNIEKALLQAGRKLFNFHACANDRGTPGEDHFDWDSISNSLKIISYKGPVVIESFTTDIKEIAKAVSLWRPLAKSQDELARNGITFLKKTLKY
jgi:D-psicose/D-tagatose/L-ribulose 3-epimerase